MVTTLEPEVRGQKSEIAESNGAHPPLAPAEDDGKRAVAARFNIGRHMLESALANAAPHEQTAMERFWKYCHSRNLDRARIGKLLKKSDGQFYSSDSIYQTLTGRRGNEGVSLGPICRAMDEFLREVEPSTGSESFIVTDLAESMWIYCDRGLRLGAVGFIFGDMSLGKTDAVIELCTNRKDNHKRLYTRMPTRGHLVHFLQAAARGLGLGDRQTVANLRQNVIEGLPDQWIIDEFDQCFLSIRNTWGLATADFIREAWDYRRRVGRPISIILIADHFGREQITKGENAKRLKRLWRRRLPRLQLPDMLSRADRNKFSRAVGLPPASRETVTIRTADGTFSDSPIVLEKEVIAASGLGYWKMILADAAENAREQRRQITWGAVLKSYSVFTAEEESDGTEEDEA